LVVPGSWQHNRTTATDNQYYNAQQTPKVMSLPQTAQIYVKLQADSSTAAVAAAAGLVQFTNHQQQLRHKSSNYAS
jgi:hypothetical protein